MSKYSNDGHKLNHEIPSPCTKRNVLLNLASETRTTCFKESNEAFCGDGITQGRCKNIHLKRLLTLFLGDRGMRLWHHFPVHCLRQLLCCPWGRQRNAKALHFETTKQMQRLILSLDKILGTFCRWRPKKLCLIGRIKMPLVIKGFMHRSRHILT